MDIVKDLLNISEQLKDMGETEHILAGYMYAKMLIKHNKDSTEQFEKVKKNRRENVQLNPEEISRPLTRSQVKAPCPQVFKILRDPGAAKLDLKSDSLKENMDMNLLNSLLVSVYKEENQKDEWYSYSLSKHQKYLEISEENPKNEVKIENMLWKEEKIFIPTQICPIWKSKVPKNK